MKPYALYDILENCATEIMLQKQEPKYHSCSLDIHSVTSFCLTFSRFTSSVPASGFSPGDTINRAPASTASSFSKIQQHGPPNWLIWILLAEIFLKKCHLIITAPQICCFHLSLSLVSLLQDSSQGRQFLVMSDMTFVVPRCEH